MTLLHRDWRVLTKMHLEGIKVENILYYIYIFEVKVIGKCGRKDVEDMEKAQKFHF
jgi:hypothetical protein